GTWRADSHPGPSTVSKGQATLRHSGKQSCLVVVRKPTTVYHRLILRFGSSASREIQQLFSTRQRPFQVQPSNSPQDLPRRLFAAQSSIPATCSVLPRGSDSRHTATLRHLRHSILRSSSHGAFPGSAYPGNRAGSVLFGSPDGGHMEEPGAVVPPATSILEVSFPGVFGP